MFSLLTRRTKSSTSAAGVVASSSSSCSSPHDGNRNRFTATTLLAVLVLVLLHGFSRRCILREGARWDEVGGSYDAEDEDDGPGIFRWHYHRHHRHRRHRHRRRPVLLEGSDPHPVEATATTASELPVFDDTQKINEEELNGELSPSDLFRGPADHEVSEDLIVAPTLAATKSKNTDASALRHSRVRLQVFIEALCIDSKRFVLDELVPAYQLLTSKVVDLELVVFGNARIIADEDDGKPWRLRSAFPASQRVKVTCQHGPAECDANSYEQCAVYVSKQTPPHLEPINIDDDDDSNDQAATQSLAYVACLFTDLDMGYRNEPFDSQLFASCAQSAFKDNSDGTVGFRIRACHDDPTLSSKLQREAALATPKDHTHVPWILINGQHTYDPMDNQDDDDNSNGPPYHKLVKAVCRAYDESGGSSDLPPACT